MNFQSSILNPLEILVTFIFLQCTQFISIWVSEGGHHLHCLKLFLCTVNTNTVTQNKFTGGAGEFSFEYISDSSSPLLWTKLLEFYHAILSLLENSCSERCGILPPTTPALLHPYFPLSKPAARMADHSQARIALEISNVLSYECIQVNKCWKIVILIQHWEMASERKLFQLESKKKKSSKANISALLFACYSSQK